MRSELVSSLFPFPLSFFPLCFYSMTKEKNKSKGKKRKGKRGKKEEVVCCCVLCFIWPSSCLHSFSHYITIRPKETKHTKNTHHSLDTLVGGIWVVFFVSLCFIRFTLPVCRLPRSPLLCGRENNATLMACAIMHNFALKHGTRSEVETAVQIVCGLRGWNEATAVSVWL